LIDAAISNRTSKNNSFLHRKSWYGYKYSAFLFDFTTKYEKMHFEDGAASEYISFSWSTYFSRRSHRPEIIVEIPMAHHNVSYRWSDRELRSFEVQEWIYDGAWKLAADLAPSGGIHSCTSKPHNLRMETSGRYEITQWFYLMSYRNFCISVNGWLYVHIEQIPSNLIFLISLRIIFKLYFSESW